MAVTSLELTSQPYEEGRSFGAAGAFEELLGTASFALDPRLEVNQVISDLDLATPGEDGLVHFSAEVSILRAVDPAKRNRRLLLDVVNRGNSIAPGMVDTAWRSFGPTGARAAGDGWMLQRGYTVVACAWQTDSPPRPGALRIDAPQALLDGMPVTGKVICVQDPDRPTKTFQLSNMGHVPYAARDLDEAGATITEMPYAGGPRTLLSRSEWQFARLDGDTVVPDATSVYREAGFEPGRFYEIVYTAEGSPVTGIGMAAMRDFVSFLRFAGREEGNPCAGDIDFALAMGASQTGRILRTMIYLGLLEDEAGRLAIDGVLAHIAGARRNEANWRFAQPSYNGLDSMSAMFPFSDADQANPTTGETDGLLHRLTARGHRPKIFQVNSSAEYWGPQHAGLVTTTLDGKQDVAIPDNVRVYHFSGTQHSSSPLPSEGVPSMPGRGAYPGNTIDYRPLLRAAFLNLDAWVTSGTAPPPSRHPNLTDGTLVDREALRSFYEKLPGPGMPLRLPPNAHVDFGADAVKLGHAVVVPPIIGEALPTLVPAIDADGNELGGIRHPDLEAPLATYTGWNPRHPDMGGADQPLRAAGASIVFPRDAAEKAATNDPRLSVEERYASEDQYLTQVRVAAEALVSERYLLEEDVERIVDYSRRRWAEYAPD